MIVTFLEYIKSMKNNMGYFSPASLHDVMFYAKDEYLMISCNCLEDIIMSNKYIVVGNANLVVEI